MNTDDMVFRSVFVDRDVDQAVLAQAKRLGASAGSVYRLFIEAGLARLSQGTPLPAVSSEPAVLRTVHVHCTSDELLKSKAFQLRMAHDELSRRVCTLGWLTIDAALN